MDTQGVHLKKAVPDADVEAQRRRNCNNSESEPSRGSSSQQRIIRSRKAESNKEAFEAVKP